MYVCSRSMSCSMWPIAVEVVINSAFKARFLSNSSAFSLFSVLILEDKFPCRLFLVEMLRVQENSTGNFSFLGFCPTLCDKYYQQDYPPAWPVRIEEPYTGREGFPNPVRVGGGGAGAGSEAQHRVSTPWKESGTRDHGLPPPHC